MQVKVAIGSRYEPKWFERRTSAGYSAKNPPLDNDAMAFQGALLKTRPRYNNAKLPTLILVVCLITIFAITYW